jgi:intracellular protein transport protein USO1
VDTLKKELEQSEQKAKSIQTELDDLLLVLGDLEEKQSRYRDKIKELGGEVTEDEEEDED